MIFKSNMALRTKYAVVVAVGIVGSYLAWQFDLTNTLPLMIFAMYLSSFATYQLLTLVTSPVEAKIGGVVIFGIGVTLDQFNMLIPDTVGTLYFLGSQAMMVYLCIFISRQNRRMKSKADELYPDIAK